jgi:hypothetical protein
LLSSGVARLKKKIKRSNLAIRSSKKGPIFKKEKKGKKFPDFLSKLVFFY